MAGKTGCSFPPPSVPTARYPAAGGSPMNDRPSLFGLATSELSQDAFLGWLLALADPRFAQADEQLHRAGRRFLDQLAEAVGGRSHPIRTVFVSSSRWIASISWSESAATERSSLSTRWMRQRRQPACRLQRARVASVRRPDRARGGRLPALVNHLPERRRPVRFLQRQGGRLRSL
jgi:hypothetical protein